MPLLPLAGPVSWRNYAAFTLVTMNHVQSPYGEISDTSQRTSSKPATHLSTCPSDPATPLIPPLYRNPVLEPVRPENSDHRHHQSIPSPPHRCGRLARSSAKSERRGDDDEIRAILLAPHPRSMRSDTSTMGTAGVSCCTRYRSFQLWPFHIHKVVGSEESISVIWYVICSDVLACDERFAGHAESSE